MRTRIEFRNELASKVDSNVTLYFQRPDNTHMDYPCIVYNIANKDDLYANDKRYKRMTRYTVTVIDENPDSSIPEALEEFEYSSFDRMYVSDGLNHFVYTIFY